LIVSSDMRRAVAGRGGREHMNGRHAELAF
jgi:hypothetical protein